MNNVQSSIFHPSQEQKTLWCRPNKLPSRLEIPIRSTDLKDNFSAKTQSCPKKWEKARGMSVTLLLDNIKTNKVSKLMSWQGATDRGSVEKVQLLRESISRQLLRKSKMDRWILGILAMDPMWFRAMLSDSKQEGVMPSNAKQLKVILSNSKQRKNTFMKWTKCEVEKQEVTPSNAKSTFIKWTKCEVEKREVTPSNAKWNWVHKVM